MKGSNHSLRIMSSSGMLHHVALVGTTWRNIPENGIHHRESLNSYIIIAQSSSYVGICLEQMQKPTKKFGQKYPVSWLKIHTMALKNTNLKVLPLNQISH
jgi:hypothetical protein